MTDRDTRRDKDVEIIDISVVISPGTPVWPGDTPFSCLWTWEMAQGSSVNVSAVTMSPHTGTHADTPLHVSRGAGGSESLPLDAFCGAAIVIDVSSIDGVIERDALEVQLGSAFPERVLLKSGMTIADGVFPNRWPTLSTQCAQWLLTRGLRLLGVDCPSVDDRDSKTLDVHHALLDHGACVLENLDLRNTAAGTYVLNALPMKVAGLDAAPVRALLTRQ
ncbi:MAG: cyclase family protein [Gemmatimonadaceae bacterium]